MTNKLRYKIESIILSCNTPDQLKCCTRFPAMGEDWAEQQYLLSVIKIAGCGIIAKSYDPLIKTFDKLSKIL